MEKSRNKVSDSFFDTFLEDYPWNKPNNGNSPQSKSRRKKKNKCSEPVFHENGPSTSFDRQNHLEYDSYNDVSGSDELNEPFNSAALPGLEILPFTHSYHQFSDTQEAKYKSRQNYARRKGKHIKNGEWSRSVSESEASDLNVALKKLKLLKVVDNSPPTVNSNKNSKGNMSRGGAFLNGYHNNLIAAEPYILEKLRQDMILEFEYMNFSNSKKKNRSKSQPTSRVRRRNDSSESPILMNTDNQNNKFSGKKRRRVKNEDHFEGLIDREEALQGLQDGTLIEGELRINSKNHTEAYICHPIDIQDVLIIGIADRNRALDSDIVAVQIKEQDKWRKQLNGSLQKTGKVVYIVELVNRRSMIGLIHRYDDSYVLFRPRDCRYPKLLVAVSTLPDDVRNNIDEFTDMYFKAQIVCWNTPKNALGFIESKIGKVGEISSETEAILSEFDLDSAPVPESLHVYLPTFPYTIPEEEIMKRLDLRNETIFSIDPETARDLDDALSIKQLPNGRYEVGVHISDVSYFLTEGTPLDEKVSERATTIYLVDRVNHMLPVKLCLLCSLLPGEDKLAFSVIWEMNEQGKIFSTKFHRTIIRSCVQLSYEHAQNIIDAKEPLVLPKLFNGKTVEDIKHSVLALYRISQHLTSKRFAGGALRIDQPKVAFRLDSDCLPYDAHLYVLRESNRLIEEFMLLANQSVAEFIHKEYPKVALLRKHAPPKEDVITRLAASLNKLGIFIETGTSGGLHNSLEKYASDNRARALVLNILCSKAMNRAVYYCYEPETHHFALNINMYTHFTSPIRRYVDIVVHRVLAAALGYSPLPSWTTETVRQYAKISNVKKYAAKRAGEASSDLFTTLYIRKIGSLETDAVVFNINSHSFDTMITSLALRIRVYIDDLKEVVVEYKENDIASSLNIKWKQLDYVQVIQMFTEVRLLLKIQQSNLQIEAQLLPPKIERYTSDSHQNTAFNTAATIQQNSCG